jgi:hypothetical protein
MVFPHIKQYKLVLQESVVDINEISMNLAMVSILYHAKVEPNDVLKKSVSAIYVDATTLKLKNNLSLTESRNYLYSVFPNLRKLKFEIPETPNENKS